MEFSWLDSETVLRVHSSCTPIPHPSPFLYEYVYITIIPCLFHNCILEADELFSSFTGLQMERSSAPGWTIPGTLPMPNLDALDDEIWDF